MATRRQALDNGLSTESRDVEANRGNMAFHLGDDVSHRREFAAGDWAAVCRSAEEAIAFSVGHEALTASPSAWLCLLAALQGTDDYARRLESAKQAVARHRLGIMEAVIADLLHWAKAVRAAYEGSAAETFQHFNQIRVPAGARLTASSRIVAAVNAKETDCATAWTAELESLAAATYQSWVLATADHGRALFAPSVDPGGLYVAALAYHALAHRPYKQACTQLAYGEHLRRAGAALTPVRTSTKW